MGESEDEGNEKTEAAPGTVVVTVAVAVPLENTRGRVLRTYRSPDPGGPQRSWNLPEVSLREVPSDFGVSQGVRAEVHPSYSIKKKAS